MLQLTFTVALYIKCVCKALARTVFGMHDQAHYYVDGVKLQLQRIIHMVKIYFEAIPQSLRAQFHHSVYLRDLGMEGVENLNDIGYLTFQILPSDANKVEPKSTTRVTGLLNNSSGNTDHLNISGSAICKLWQVLHANVGIDFKRTMFLDFGCGTGLALLSAMTQPFHSILGVDLDACSCKLAEMNISKFRDSPQRLVPIQCAKVDVLAQDMAEFRFTHISRDLNTIVLYMYEPLWAIPKPRAHQIYLDILTRAAKISGKRVLVAYFYAGWFNGDALPALREINAKYLTDFPFDTLDFGSSATCYIYQLN
eukprot:gene14262-16394_t